MGFPGFCAASGATIQPQEVQVSLTAEESRVYGYTAQLEVSLEGEAATVKVEGRTGVEMEALTAVSAAALTVYDMCKAVQKDMVIERICLLSKRGGKSGEIHQEELWNTEQR